MAYNAMYFTESQQSLLHAGFFLAYSLAHIEKLKFIYLIKRRRIENEDSSHIQNSTIMLAYP